MKKFQWLKRSAGLLLVAAGMFGAMQVSAADPEVYTVHAPEKDLKIQFWLEEGVPYYHVESEGKILIEDAKLGLNTSLGAWKDGFTLKDATSSSDDTTWEPIVGEQDVIRDCYNETKFVLAQESGIELGITMRAYDEGVALRYELPDMEEDYKITDEYTQFTFPAGTYANAHVGGNQTVPSRMAVESITGSTMQRPMTLQFTDGQLMTICEANLDHYDTMVLKKDSSKARTVKAAYGGSNTITADTPDATPWRALVIAEDETDLADNATLVMNLNEAPDEETYGFSEWVEPGSCLRAASGMNNSAIKKVVDQAQRNGIKYVLLDTGWYGPENDANCDPRLDPTKLDLNNAKDKFLMDNYFATEGGYNNTGEGVFDTKGHGFSKYGSLGQSGDFNTEVDIPMLCDYANERGVGIILYVNGVLLPDRSGRNRFTTDEMFAYFEKWGVKGVKPGFVKVRSQSNETYLEEQVIKSAAKHKLVMTIHDEYVASGLERTYPNLMQEEGILGDEGIGKNNPQVDKDIATLFTRTIQGPADHTFCYPGKGTKAYALASPIMFRAGMSLLYWYTDPESIPVQDQSKVGIWKDFPGTWSKTLYLEGKMYQYATYARKTKEDVWYVGSLSAVNRTLEVPLDFLDEDTWYVADVYADGADADPYAGWNSAAKEAQLLENEKYLVNSSTVLQRDLKYGFGYAVKLTKATESDLQAYMEYNHSREELKYTLEGAKLLERGTYTEESWQKLQSAMAAAEALIANGQSEDEAMQAAALELADAIEHLCSLKDFNAVMKKASLYTKHQFTAASWRKVADAIAAAEEMLEGSLTQEEIDEITAALNAAIEGLQRRENLQADQILYLSDLDYNAEKSTFIRSERFHKDKNRAEGTLTLMVNGVKTAFERGVGMDAWANVYYDIEGLGYETFEAYVGVDAEKSSQGDIIFRVYGDGALLYESKPSGNGSQNAQFVSVPVAGVKELYLESDMNGTDNGDWADWADAKFLSYESSYTSQLNRVIAMIEGLDASEYTEESWAAVEEALAAAKAVAADLSAAQSEIDEALGRLLGAFGNLEYGVQKLHLEVAIEVAEELLALGKNYEDTDVLTAAVEAGKGILKDKAATQEAVDNAAYAVLEELFKMAKTADVSSLESLIETAKGLLDEKYTADSLENLKDAIEHAEGILEDQNRADDAIGEAYGRLIDAIMKLERKSNKAALKAMLDKANEVLNAKDAYVAETIEGLAEVTAEAQAVYDNDEALQGDVDEAVKALTLKVAEARLLGDVNGDGAVTTADSAAVLRSAAELTSLSAADAASADVNGDGAADTSDAVLILQYAAEKIAAF